MPIFTSGRISHNIQSVEASLQATQQQEQVTILDIKKQVAQAYITVLRTESAAQVAQSHVDSLAAHDRDVSNLYAQEMVARNDLLAAGVELADAQQRVVQAENQLDIARSQYNQLLNRPLHTAVELVPKFPDIPANSLAGLTQQALNKRPEIVVLSRQIESLEQQAQSIKADLLSQVTINGGYQYQENRYQAFEGMWKAGVGIEWKLFDGSTRHKSESVIRQAIALKEQRDDLSSQIALQVRQAWLEIQETQKRIEVTRQAIAQAEENMKVTADRYREGLSNNTDVLRAEYLRTVTHDNFNNASYNHSQAKVNLRRALGDLLLC